MSLIIEGSDNLGKTTFAKKLIRYIWDHDKYPVMYSWMTRPNEETFDFCESYKMMLNPYTVQDRFHLGALAYHKNKLSFSSLNLVEHWIENCGGLVVLFYAENESWYENYISKDKRGNLLDIQTLCKANSVFKRIALRKHKLHPMIDYAFDISEKHFPSDTAVKFIANDWIRKRREFIMEILENQ